MKVLHLDSNHPILAQGLADLGIENHFDYKNSKEDVLKKIDPYQGIVIRSRFSIDKDFLDAAKNLKFIGRVGAGLENIDTDYASSKGVVLISAPEGNANAVGEHALGMLLSLMNNLQKADHEVKSGHWDREGNRGYEIGGKTVGIIGYGTMGTSFAKKLRGFDCRIVCYDIRENLSDEYTQQLSLKEFKEQVDIISLHLPQTTLTEGMIDDAFFESCKKNIWIINTGRGKTLVTSALVKAIKSGKVLGAGLDVLEYEKASFETISKENTPDDYKFILESHRVLLSPHVAGWTFESHQKLAKTIVEKVRINFFS